MKSVDLVEH